MNATQLLEHFDRLSEAPGAVPRLRRFILDLAVRGKLVTQEAGDEPAVELLKKVRAEQTRLVKLRNIKKSAASRALTEDEQPFKLPRNWTWCWLGDIGDWGSGSTPPRGNSEYYGNDIAWLKSGELGDSLALKGSAERVSQLALQRCSFRLNQPGDVLIAMYGATIGKLAILAEEAVTNQAVCGCTPFRGVFNRYLFLFLQSQRADFHSQSEGGAQPNISKVKIVTSAFALPPLAEQHRIVAKVDELMALCDQLEAAQQERERRRDRLAAASLQRLNQPAADTNPETQRDYARFHLHHLPRLTTRPEYIKAMRQTILNLAVCGKLVPQDVTEESASELLMRIQAEKVRLVKECALKKVNDVNPIREEELLFPLPKRWEWIRIGDLLFGDSQNGYSKRPDDAVDGIPILRISAGTVRQDGVVAEEEFKLIGGITAAQRRQYEVTAGDLLACRFNGNRRFVGRISLYTGYLGNSPIYPDKLIRLRLLPGFVLPELVRHFAESEPVRKDIEVYCATTVGNWGISASNMKDVKIPLPPLSEQHRIVAKVDALMALCDQLEAQLSTTQTDSRRLLEAVLDAALTPA